MGKTDLKFREQMASKAFNLTAYYDSVISNWFNDKLAIKFPIRKTFFWKKNRKITIWRKSSSRKFNLFK